MGTFIIKPTNHVSGGGQIIDGNGSIPPNYAGWLLNDYPSVTILQAVLALANDFFFQVAVFDDAGIGDFQDTLRFTFVGNCIYLDGSPTPVSFASLQSGFTPTQAQINISLSTIQQPAGSTASYFLQQEPGNNGPDQTDIYEYDFTPPTAPTMLDIVSNGCGLKVFLHIEEEGNVVALTGFFDLFVSGTYEIQSTTFTLDPETTPVGRATRVVINRISLNTPSCTQIRGVEVEYEDEDGNTIVIPAPIIAQNNVGPPTLDSVTFIVPPLPQFVLLIFIFVLVPTPQDIPPSNDFTEFNGRVPLGSLEVLLADASGIYTLVPGKTSDTLYDRDGTTIDYEIPSPFGKTGFIGG